MFPQNVADRGYSGPRTVQLEIRERRPNLLAGAMQRPMHAGGLAPHSAPPNRLSSHRRLESAMNRRVAVGCL